jgi:hypothetical protein
MVMAGAGIKSNIYFTILNKKALISCLPDTLMLDKEEGVLIPLPQIND